MIIGKKRPEFQTIFRPALTPLFPGCYNAFMKKIGIIGGSGLDDPQILKDFQEKNARNKFGQPSSSLKCGKIDGTDVVILARHGRDHSVMPTRINFQANILALKEEGCTHILAATAVGSLREEIKPGNLVFPSQFIDFTRHRNLTMFPEKVVHTPMSDPYDKKLTDILCKVSDELGYDYNRDVTVVTIEGPRFSTKAESHMFRAWGADIINMSTCPEVILANELQVPYQTIAMSTDYDCWKEDEEPVTFEMVMERMKENADKVKKLIIKSVGRI
jgi:5'-methylthioadenosine phosphorylase